MSSTNGRRFNIFKKCRSRKKRTPEYVFPSSTEYKIIFPFKEDCEIWDKTDYSSSKTKDAADAQEINDFFYGLEQETNTSFHKMKNYKKFAVIFFRVNALLFALGLLLLIIGLAAKPSDYTGSLPPTAKAGFAMMGILIFEYIMYTICFLIPKLDDNKYNYVDGVEIYVQRENEVRFKSKGLRWKVGEDTRWIELIIEPTNMFIED